MKKVSITKPVDTGITRQELYERHQAFQLIATSQNPMWRAMFFLQRKNIDKWYQAKASDNIPNSAKVNSMVKRLNEMQHEYLEHGEDGQPKIDDTKEQVNGQPVFLLKEGKNIADFNQETSKYLSSMVSVKD